MSLADFFRSSPQRGNSLTVDPLQSSMQRCSAGHLWLLQRISRPKNLGGTSKTANERALQFAAIKFRDLQAIELIRGRHRAHIHSSHQRNGNIARLNIDNASLRKLQNRVSGLPFARVRLLFQLRQSDQCLQSVFDVAVRQHRQSGRYRNQIGGR